MSDFTFLNLLFTVILLLYTNYTFYNTITPIKQRSFYRNGTIFFYKKMQLTIKPTN